MPDTMSTLTATCRCGTTTGSAGGVTAFSLRCAWCPTEAVEPVDEIDLPDEELLAMWDEADCHPLYRTEGAPRWFQAVEIVDEWLHYKHRNLTGWRNELMWWLYRPLCNIRDWRYSRGSR
jgi:hypothetical protein